MLEFRRIFPLVVAAAAVASCSKSNETPPAGKANSPAHSWTTDGVETTADGFRELSTPSSLDGEKARIRPDNETNKIGLDFLLNGMEHAFFNVSSLGDKYYAEIHRTSEGYSVVTFNSRKTPYGTADIVTQFDFNAEGLPSNASQAVIRQVGNFRYQVTGETPLLQAAAVRLKTIAALGTRVDQDKTKVWSNIRKLDNDLNKDNLKLILNNSEQASLHVNNNGIQYRAQINRTPGGYEVITSQKSPGLSKIDDDVETRIYFDEKGGFIDSTQTSIEHLGEERFVMPQQGPGANAAGKVLIEIWYLGVPSDLAVL